jgi:hypothetical protein
MKKITLAYIAAAIMTRTPNLWKFIPDKKYIEILFKGYMGRHIDWNNPMTFNEKLNWLKIYGQNPLYSALVDKYEVKKYVSKKIGCQYVIPTLGVYDNFDEIDFSKLPNKFVLKCTHDSGSVCLIDNKETYDFSKAKARLEKHLIIDWYWINRECPYKNVKPRIIAETLMEDLQANELTLMDYKIHVFNGEPLFIGVDFDRFTHHKRNLYSTNWEYIDVQYNFPSDKNKIIEKPKELAKMLKLASVLAEDIPYVRVDFYYFEGKIYFGEMTFIPEGGFGKFIPESFDYRYGECLKL